jgi:hypothetical protein
MEIHKVSDPIQDKRPIRRSLGQFIAFPRH